MQLDLEIKITGQWICFFAQHTVSTADTAKDPQEVLNVVTSYDEMENQFLSQETVDCRWRDKNARGFGSLAERARERLGNIYTQVYRLTNQLTT